MVLSGNFYKISTFPGKFYNTETWNRNYVSMSQEISTLLYSNYYQKVIGNFEFPIQ